MSALVLPHNITLRSYQEQFMGAMDVGFQRAALVWHRRAGKDLAALNWCIKKTQERVGVYYEFFPTFKQGRKILWNGITGMGTTFMSYFPDELIKRRREDDMLIELTNGSIWQIIGTDNMDQIVGTNPVGCIFSEWSLMNPRAWDLTQPILLENEGWAVFVYTPRGKNHGYKLAMMAEKDPMWYYSYLTIADTVRDALGEDRHGQPVMTEAMIEQIRKEGLTSSDLIEQEYYCSWSGEQDAFFYGKQMSKAEEEGRVGDFPWIPNLPVHTAWDIGVSDRDGTAIWFFQYVGEYVHFIDYYENTGDGLPHYVKHMAGKPYIYAPMRSRHFAPHDIKVKEWSTGKTRFETAQKLGINFQIIPKLKIGDGINAVREILPRCKFDSIKCKDGIYTLENYSKEYDDRKQCYKNKPQHDWCSHGADSFRQFALGYRGDINLHHAQTQAYTEFNPMETLDPRATELGLDQQYEREFDPFKF